MLDIIVPELSGEEESLNSLAGSSKWLYFYNVNRKAIVPVEINLVAKEDSDTCFLLTLDNAKSVILPQSALVLMRGGNYKYVKDLLTADSVMPFCLSSWGSPGLFYTKHNFGDNRHEYVYQPRYRIWEPVHHVVFREIYGHPLKFRYIVHHKDDNGFNNLPENLQEMHYAEHNRISGSKHFKKILIDREYRTKCIGRDVSDDEYAEIIYQKKIEASKKRWATKGMRERQSVFMKEENKKRLCTEYSDKLSKSVRKGRLHARLLREGLTPTEEKKQLEKQFEECGCFVPVLAKIRGQHVGTVRRRLRLYNIIPEPVPEDLLSNSEQVLCEKREKLRKALSDNVTLTDAAKELGIHPQTLRRRMNVLNVRPLEYVDDNTDNHKVVSLTNIGIKKVLRSVLSDHLALGIEAGIFVRF